MDKQLIRDKIMAIYETDHRIADDYALLLALYWEQDWDYNSSLYANLKRQTRAESIIRRARDLRSEGKIKPSEHVIKERMQAFINERDEHSSQAGFGDMLRRIK